MYITSTLVSDEANSGNQTLSQLLSQAKVLVVVDSKASWLFSVLLCTASTGIFGKHGGLCLARSYDYLLALSNGLSPCIGEASAVQFQSVFLPLSSYPLYHGGRRAVPYAARPLAGSSPLFWCHASRGITLILVTPLQMKALYVLPMLSSFDVASHPVDVEDHVQQR